MDLLLAMKTFVATVEAGSFAGAADKLDVSRAMVSKQVQKLEDHLDTRLLNRTTRRLSLTETGGDFHKRSVQILADVEEAEQIAGQATRRPHGVLRAALPLAYGQHRLAALIGAFTLAYPAVHLDISLSDRRVDLIEEGFDVAIRIGALPESDLIVRRLGEVRSIVCAAPAYLHRCGIPRTPADLGRHACLGYALTGSGTEWHMEGAQGTVTVPIAGPIRADNGDVLCLAALGGAGIVFQPHFIVDEHIASGRLVRLLPDWHSAQLGVHAVYPSRKHLSAKVRTFVDFLVAALD